MRETIQNANGKQFHAVSLSGGKDSTAMLLLMIERDMPINIAEDYIPVGMVMDMDGKTVRVDKVDFPNEEVSLTDITDRKNPVPFRERLSIVRSYVEDAPAESLWKAMDRREHPSQKKTSVLAKLKEHAKSAPDKCAKKPEHTKKPKSKEMEM